MIYNVGGHMFNLDISEDTYLRLKREGYVFEYAEKMLTIRGGVRIDI